MNRLKALSSGIKAFWIGLVLCAVLAGCQRGTSSIAYLRVTDNYWEVWITTPDGQGDRQLTRFKSDVSRISWYPNGRDLLVNLHDGRLFEVNTETGESSAIQAPMPGILDAVVSPDGKRATFSLSTSASIDDNDIWTFDLASSQMEKMTSMPRLQHEPTWSHDGQSIYFLSGKGDQSHDIWRVNLSDRQTEQLTVNAAYHFDLALRRDGVIAFSSNKAGTYDVWLRGRDGKTEQLTNDVTLEARPSWSPDGDELVYESTSEGVTNLWRLNVGSRQRRQLTQAPQGARLPVWSPIRSQP